MLAYWTNVTLFKVTINMLQMSLITLSHTLIYSWHLITCSSIEITINHSYTKDAECEALFGALCITQGKQTELSTSKNNPVYVHYNVYDNISIYLPSGIVRSRCHQPYARGHLVGHWLLLSRPLDLF